MAPLFFFDNPLVRFLIENPENWNTFDDYFKNESEKFFRPVSSYYSFFEYIGFTKDNLTAPSDEMFHFDIYSNEEKAVDNIKKIGKLLDQYYEEACLNVQEQLQSKELKILLNDKVKNQLKRASSFEGSYGLKNVLFQEMLDLFEDDYDEFAKIAAMYLAWDYFCNISPTGIAIEIFRKTQLGVWMQLWEKGFLLPFGKIIDDLLIKPEVDKRSKFKGWEDMVDAEAITFVMLGLINSNGGNDCVNYITCDPIDCVKERIRLGESALSFLEQTLGKIMNRNFGMTYCCEQSNIEKTFKFTNKVLLPAIQINLFCLSI